MPTLIRSLDIRSRRLWRLVAILLLAFGLRLHDLDAPDLDLDESWSMVHIYGLLEPGLSPVRVLAVEPNNALHLVLASAVARFMPTAIGLRWLSLMASLLTVAVSARLAARLAGSRAAILAALLVSVSYGGVVYAQIGRPYALAMLFALLSLLFWLERRWRLNMVFSAFVPLAHIGAMPVVMAQDATLLWTCYRKKRRIPANWIINRIAVYSMFGLVLLLMVLRRMGGKVMSAGQAPPDLATIGAHALELLYGGQPLTTVGLQDVLVLAGFVVPVAALWLTYAARRRPPRASGIVALAAAGAYLGLWGMAVASDGPIKFVHLPYVAPLLLVVAAVTLAHAPRVLAWASTVLFYVAAVTNLTGYYQTPDQFYTEAARRLDDFRQGQVIYTDQETALAALRFNVPETAYVELFQPVTDAPPEQFLYLGYRNFPPPLPETCAPAPVLEYGAFHLHECGR